MQPQGKETFALDISLLWPTVETLQRDLSTLRFQSKEVLRGEGGGGGWVQWLVGVRGMDPK